MGRESCSSLKLSVNKLASHRDSPASMEALERSRKSLKRSCNQVGTDNEETSDSSIAGTLDNANNGVSARERAQLTRPTSSAAISDDAQSSTARDGGISNQEPASPAPTGGHLNRRAQQDADENDETDEMVALVPLHQMESENERLDLEAALRFHHNRRVLLARLEETFSRGRLHSINLARRDLGSTESRLIAQVIQANPQLSTLKLCYNQLGDEGATIIAGALRREGEGRHHDALQILDLGFNDIGDVGCHAISTAMAGNYTLQSLYLTGNRIEENGALSLARAILHGVGLRSLYLSVNRIGSRGMAAIAVAIAKNDQRLNSPEACAISAEAPTRRMEHLHISATLTDPDGFEAVAGLVLSTSALKTLCLTDNNLDDHDMVLLSHAFAQNKSIPIESIRLGYNQITCQGVECFMNAIWGSPTLREIKLNHNKLQDRGAQLCAVVLTSIALKSLDISFNRVTTVGIKALMKNLSENTSLLSLSLCGIPIDLNASKAVSYALAYNSSLRELYVDNCSTGYSSQRHIVAGVVSNRRSSLCVLTGFAVAPIAMTLGMPNLPTSWSNFQVLGFFQAMWSQWLLKSGRGSTATDDQAIRGPAPPAAVAAAAKIALTSLGSGSPDIAFPRAEAESLMTERPPIDAARMSLMERSSSGSITVPDFANDLNGDLDEWLDREWQKDIVSDSSSVNHSPLDNPERRNRNLQWLRARFRSLNEVGRLPFNNADLWQLHQYYFSPPLVTMLDSEKPPADAPIDGHESATEPETRNKDETEPSSVALSLGSQVVSANFGRSVSFQALGDAFARSSLIPNVHKRGPQGDADVSEYHATKRAKSLSKPRIGYYPRIMAKIQSLGNKPMEQSLRLLRQLRYVENVMFATKDPYHVEPEKPEDGTEEPNHSDIEMILLDLL